MVWKKPNSYCFESGKTEDWELLGNLPNIIKNVSEKGYGIYINAENCKIVLLH